MHQDSPSPVAEITSSKRFANASNAALVSAAFAPPSLASPKATLRASKSRMASSERWDPLDLLGWGFSIRTQQKKTADRQVTKIAGRMPQTICSWKSGTESSGKNVCKMVVTGGIYKWLLGSWISWRRYNKNYWFQWESYLLIPQCLIKPGCFGVGFPWVAQTICLQSSEFITFAMTWGLPRRACDPHKGVENSQENGDLTWFQRLRSIHLLKSCTLQKAEQALHASWDPWGTPHVGISKCSKCCTISFKNKLGHNLHFFQVLQEITHGSHLNIKNNFKKGIMKNSIFLSILRLTTPWWNIQPIPLENPPYRKGRQVPTIFRQ